MIKIVAGDGVIRACVSVIIVPEKAVAEPGYIQAFSENTAAASKHEFHAMAQTAYFQFQDDELEIETMKDDVRIVTAGGDESLHSGILLCRDGDGGLHVLVHEGVNKKKILESAYRFFTRWIRLDI